MGSQGFHNVAGNPFVYQEDTLSAAIGIDVADQYWVINVSSAPGALPVNTAQVIINPAGNIRILPNVVGNVILDSVYYPKTVLKGDILVASSDTIIGVVTGATTAGYILTANGAGTVPTFQASVAGGIATLAGDSGTATGATVTIAGTANQITTSATSATVTLSIPSSPSLPGTVTAATGFVSTNGSVIINNTAASAAFAELDFQKSRTGAAITSGDGLGELLFKGHDGTGFITGSQITATNSGTVATNRIASDLKFYTHPDSTTSSTLRMTIASTGATTIASPDSGVGLTVSGGGITCTSGNIAASSGTLSASTTVTAGTNLVSTAGNLLLPTTSSTVGQVQINSVREFHAYGTGNTFVGENSGNFTLTVANAAYNVGCGRITLNGLTTGGGNCAFGNGAGYVISSGSSNVLQGAVSGFALTQGSYNLGCGDRTIYRLTTGSYNVVYGSDGGVGSGYGAGYNYTGAESSNILVNHIGVTGESNVMRLGTSGSGNGQINKAYIAGTYGVTPGGTINVALVDSNGQLGSVATGATGTVLSGNGVGSAPSFQAVSGTFVWSVSSAATINAVKSNGYILDKNGLQDVYLPTFGGSVGDRFSVMKPRDTGFKIQQNANQQVSFGVLPTPTIGVGHGLASSTTLSFQKLDIYLMTISGGTESWWVTETQGSYTIF